MKTQRTTGGEWSRTTMLIRSDILERAREKGIDIDSACNEVLADMLGIDYRQQQIPSENAVHPVIIAKDPPEATELEIRRERGGHLRPVLNADDPATPARLLKMKKTIPAKVRQGEQYQTPTGKKSEDKDTSTVPSGSHGKQQAPEHAVKGSSRKGKENDLIRQFLSQKILRTEPGGGDRNRITKDEMYQLYVRFCRTKHGVKVVDRKMFAIALKNRFVMEEGSAGGVSYWNNVTLR